MSKRYRVAVDIGGTFVDAVEFDRQTGSLRLRKASSTPTHPAAGVLEAVRKLGTDLSQCQVFIHGTTLGLNAILERKGAVTGILTNQGFRDIFLIGRADVPPLHMYDVCYARPPHLVRRRHTAGVPARIDVKGEVLTPLNEKALLAAAGELVKQGVESVAVCFLHSYRNPSHEEQALELLRQHFPQLRVSISSRITREYREYERTSTTVLEAYIRPIFESYLEELQRELSQAGFRGHFLIMRSGGGAMTAQAAARSPIHTLLSGPAGGIEGAAFLARTLERGKLLSLDFGGTSLDACVIEKGIPVRIHQATLEHYPVLIPVFDIRCIGAGGGSIGWVDEGLLRVGPQSAGAEPGPIAYGKGGKEPTTTDAALLLGYLDPQAFLGGEMPLDAQAARRGVEARLARPLGMETLQAAAGMFQVMLARTVGAIREITVERGLDPREFSLLAFGGAGPMVAPLLAREMGIPEIIIPRAPAAFSAWGMLMSDLAWDFSQTEVRLLSETPWQTIRERFRQLEELGRRALAEQGVERRRQSFQRSLEMRHLGQEHTLEVDLAGLKGVSQLEKAFRRLHEIRYGHSTPDPVQIVTFRLRALGRTDKPPLEALDSPAVPSGPPFFTRSAFCFRRRRMVPFRCYRRSQLEPGRRLQGPLIVEEGTSTTVIHSDQQLEVDPYGHLIIRRKA